LLLQPFLVYIFFFLDFRLLWLAFHYFCVRQLVEAAPRLVFLAAILFFFFFVLTLANVAFAYDKQNFCQPRLTCAAFKKSAKMK